MQQIHFKPALIDIVYLWVDGSDPVWQEKRQRAYSAWAEVNPDALAVHGNAAGRYRDNGELRFNLRALEKFFPGHGHVYIVTDEQTPAWLYHSDRVTIVDHRDLIPGHSTHLFDSGHIESWLHHIPGLAEQFIYLNDDVFFGENVPRERVSSVRTALAGADALLVAGSSLMVYSGYRFVEDAIASNKPVAVVNIGRTRADAVLTLKIDHEVGAALDALASHLDGIGFD